MVLAPASVVEETVSTGEAAWRDDLAAVSGVKRVSIRSTTNLTTNQTRSA